MTHMKRLKTLILALKTKPMPPSANYGRDPMKVAFEEFLESYNQLKKWDGARQKGKELYARLAKIHNKSSFWSKEYWKKGDKDGQSDGTN